MKAKLQITFEFDSCGGCPFLEIVELYGCHALREQCGISATPTRWRTAPQKIPLTLCPLLVSKRRLKLRRVKGLTSVKAIK